MNALFAIASGLEYAPPQAPPAPEFGPLLVRLFGMTLFVLAFCGLLMWLTRRVRRPRIPAGSGESLTMIDSAILTGRCSVHLLKTGGARVLVAVDPGGLKACLLVDDNFAGVLAGVDPGATPRPAGPSVAEMLSLLAASKAA